MQSKQEEQFWAQWPACLNSMESLYGQQMPLPDDRYKQTKDCLQKLRGGAAVSEIAKVLGELWNFDERSFGFTLDDYGWAVYSLCYLSKDEIIIQHLLNIYMPLLGTYIQEALGENFHSKVGVTFIEDVDHVLWDVQGLIEPEDHGLFDWYVNRNELPIGRIEDFLRMAGLPPLKNSNYPPRYVLLRYTNLCGDPFSSDENYLQGLRKFYLEQGYYVDSGDILNESKQVNGNAFFCHLSSVEIAEMIQTAKASVCYVGPGIQIEPAKAMVDLAGRIGPELLTLSLDFDEHIMRMGYGDIAAVKMLGDTGIVINHSPGLRSALIIVDGEGYTFTPTPLYLEAEGCNPPSALEVKQLI